MLGLWDTPKNRINWPKQIVMETLISKLHCSVAVLFHSHVFLMVNWPFVGEDPTRDAKVVIDSLSLTKLTSEPSTAVKATMM